MLRISLIFASFFILLDPQKAFAHAFGQQYTLPVPFWLYAYGAAGAVILSFAIVGFFVTDRNSGKGYPKIDITKTIFAKLINNKLVIYSLKIITLVLFIFTILTGLIGTHDPTLNFNMTFFWIVFLLGLTYLTAIFGDIYSVINPLKTVGSFIEIEKGGLFSYPEKFGYFPALISYFLLIWIELIGRADPYQLSIILIIYSSFAFLGINLIGAQKYFKYCDIFSVFLSVVGKISIFEKKDKKIFIRPPFVGLILEKTEKLSLLAFIIFMLSSTAFDGFRETQPWWDIYFSLVQPVQNILQDNTSIFINTLGLLLAPVLFLGIYLTLIFIMKVLVKSKYSLKQLAVSFSFSLLPIALVYNIAHYYTLLVIQGQSVISIASDPFGFGWNLFNTKDFIPNIGIIDTTTIWHSEVGFILLGHIVAVYLSHVIALRIFPNHKTAIISQIPMLVLMVIYTVIGLWILSQPLTSGL